MGGDVVILVAHDSDVATGKIEFAAGSDLVIREFIDDGDRQLQVHVDLGRVGPMSSAKG